MLSRENFDFWLDRVEILNSDASPAEKARKLARLGHDAGDAFEMVSTGLSEMLIDPRDEISNRKG